MQMLTSLYTYILASDQGHRSFQLPFIGLICSIGELFGWHIWQEANSTHLNESGWTL